MSDSDIALLKETEREAFEERAGIVEFDGGLSSEEAERLALAEVLNNRSSVVHAAAPAVVHAVVHATVDGGVVHNIAPGDVHKESVVVHGPANDDRYKDREARKAYRREWMRERRRVQKNSMARSGT
jgi:hypothetical protein